MLTHVLALEWAAHKITVNAVAPTFVETELARRTLDRPGVRDYWTSRIPLGRIATVEEVAAALVYLASPAANFITGAVLPIDGGFRGRGREQTPYVVRSAPSACPSGEGV